MRRHGQLGRRAHGSEFDATTAKLHELVTDLQVLHLAPQRVRPVGLHCTQSLDPVSNVGDRDRQRVRHARLIVLAHAAQRVVQVLEGVRC